MRTKLSSYRGNGARVLGAQDCQVAQDQGRAVTEGLQKMKGLGSRVAWRPSQAVKKESIVNNTGVKGTQMSSYRRSKVDES